MSKKEFFKAYIITKRDTDFYLVSEEDSWGFDDSLHLMAYIAEQGIKRVYVYNDKSLAFDLIKGLKEAGYTDRSIDTSNAIYDCEYKYSILGGKFYKLQYKPKGKKPVSVYDFFNISNQSKRKLLKGFKLEAGFEEKNLAHILQECLDAGLIHSTIASCAFADFSSMVGKKKLNQEIKTPISTHQKFQEIWRRSYKSGTVYTKGNNIWVDEPVTILDANQLYPFVLSTDEILGKRIVYPSSECVYVKRDVLTRFNSILARKGLFIAHLKVKGLKVKDYGFPFFTLPDSDEYFPGFIIKENTHELDIVVNSVEFEMLQEEYSFTYEVLEYWAFGELIPSETFGAYYSKWLKIREEAKEEGNKSKELIAKFMCNALSGRFGLRSDLQKSIINGETVSAQKTQTESRVSIPIASFFISYARRYMVQICKPYHLQGRLYYTDTDSLHFTGDILPETKRLIGNRLGQLKDETQQKYSTRAKAQYIGQKLYLIGDKDGRLLKVTIAGLNEEGQQWALDNITLTQPISTITIPGGRTQARGKGLDFWTTHEDYILDTASDTLTTNLLHKQQASLIRLLGI